MKYEFKDIMAFGTFILHCLPLFFIVSGFLIYKVPEMGIEKPPL